MSFSEDCLKVKEASRELASLNADKRNAILEKFAYTLILKKNTIIEENKKDLETAKQMNIPSPMLDRLMLNADRIKSIADGVISVSKLSDPLGIVLEEKTVQSGLLIKKVSVPIGVVGMIYEARPNVTADSMALALKSGNACILKGGKEAIKTNCAIEAIMKQTLRSLGYNEYFVHLIKDTTRETTNLLMKAKGDVDVLIPRGGAGLIKSVVENSTVPVIETGAGNCHIYVDETAGVNMAIEIVANAKTSRPSVCNAVETLLVHEKIAEKSLPLLYERLNAKNVELRGDDKCREILGEEIKKAEEIDYETEYNDLILAVKVVSDIKAAVGHINKYSTSHSEAIITESKENAEYFLDNVDSATVYVNASTRFTDGGEFGMGAEIGISTQKLHPRGPMGLRELTSYKYKVYGNGEIR